MTTLFAALLLAIALIPVSSEAGPRKRVVVVRPAARPVVVVAKVKPAARVWVPGQWVPVSPRRVIWIPAHWERR